VNALKIKNILSEYNPGDYIHKKEMLIVMKLRMILEYMLGVTMPRSSINRIKPVFISGCSGDVLEVGGRDAYFKEIYQGGKYINLDIKEGKHVDVVENAESLESFKDSSVSAIVCISVLEHTPDPNEMIKQFHRVLKPGGKVLLSAPWMYESHMDPYDYHRFSENYYGLLSDKFKVVFLCRTNGYFGLLAHFFQRKYALRLSIGVLFLIIDMLLGNRGMWSTQITVSLEKK